MRRSVHKLDRKYYQDGENAYEMHCTLNREVVSLPLLTEADVAVCRPDGGYPGVKLPEGSLALAAGSEASVPAAAASSGAGGDV